MLTQSGKLTIGRESVPGKPEYDTIFFMVGTEKGMFFEVRMSPAILARALTGAGMQDVVYGFVGPIPPEAQARHDKRETAIVFIDPVYLQGKYDVARDNIPPDAILNNLHPDFTSGGWSVESIDYGLYQGKLCARLARLVDTSKIEKDQQEITVDFRTHVDINKCIESQIVPYTQGGGALSDRKKLQFRPLLIQDIHETSVSFGSGTLRLPVDTYGVIWYDTLDRRDQMSMITDNPILLSLTALGIDYTVTPAGVVLEGYYKSGVITLAPNDDGRTFTALSRYGETTQINDFDDLVRLNHVWFNRSLGRFPGWNTPAGVWGDHFRRLGLEI
jgi:hypothetical protein